MARHARNRLHSVRDRVAATKPAEGKPFSVLPPPPAGRGGLREREWMFDQRELVEELVASPLGNCMVKVSWELRGSRRSQLVPDTRNGIKFILNYFMHII